MPPTSVIEKKSIIYFIGFLIFSFLLFPIIARATSIGTNVTVTGTTTLNGNTTIGDSATADTLTVTARLAADLDPSANNTYDLGSFGLAYKSIYTSSTVYLGSVTSTQITPWANNTSQLGQFGQAWKNIFVSSTSYLGSVTSTMINPWANNTSDLGAYGNAWKNFYASSTVYLTSVSTTQGIEAAPDTDTNFKFGRAAIFVPTPVTDALAIAHVDNASVLNFALYQDAAGATAINAKAGQLMGFAIGAVTKFNIDATSFYAEDGSGPSLQNEAATTDNPTLIPDRNDLTAGIGGSGGALALITGGSERLTIASDGDVSTNGNVLPGVNNFYNLGNNSDFAWKNLYVTSTAFLRYVSSTMIEPYINNQSNLGSFGKAWKNVYASSTVFANTVSTTGQIYSGGNLGVASSTAPAQLSVGSGATATSTVSFGALCFRAYSQSGDTDNEVYYWPCVGAACPTVAMAAAGWATSTVSCF